MVSILYIAYDVKFTKNYFSCFKQFFYGGTSWIIALHLFLQCSLAFEDAKWSRGDSGRPARAHKVRVVFKLS